MVKDKIQLHDIEFFDNEFTGEITGTYWDDEDLRTFYFTGIEFSEKIEEITPGMSVIDTKDMFELIGVFRSTITPVLIELINNNGQDNTSNIY